ncbi:glycosyltransferase family 4 protein [Psychroserpens luteolus]|uniref:glycosyltransferase family 4 protein n=1 Tax=Psychroserpens luteolus TaxID=2855840 RepID=UPI001E38144C|nr:glycosyltransferase family 4 protein [Psychroserpens luteolus]MCD2259809.1 glycosyltransferase family 4 protein [Psychroserpens luteolus]
MRIAVFSGVIPSTTFIEHLIEGIANSHDVLLFGTLQKPKTYHSNRIKTYSNSKSKFKSFVVSCYRFLILMFRYPKRLSVLFSEVKKQKGTYNKRRTLVRVLPVILYKPDVFHIQWAKDLEHWVFLKETLNVKLVLSLRGAHINYSPIANETLAKSYQINFPKVDAFHAVSEAISIEAQRYNAEATKIKVVHSPIPASTFEHFSTYKIPESAVFNICVVGRFHWKKGYKYALDACKILKDKGFDFHLTFIASNPVSEAVLFQIHQLELINHVTILKGLPQADLFKLMKTFNVQLLSSLEEGIANVVLEAMAIGLPVIATHCGGMAEVVKPNTNGWLIPVRDAEAIANSIIEVSQSSEGQLKEITQNAHDFVKHHFQALDSIQKFEELYQSVLK